MPHCMVICDGGSGITVLVLYTCLTQAVELSPRGPFYATFELWPLYSTFEFAIFSTSSQCHDHVQFPIWRKLDGVHGVHGVPGGNCGQLEGKPTMGTFVQIA